MIEELIIWLYYNRINIELGLSLFCLFIEDWIFLFSIGNLFDEEYTLSGNFLKIFNKDLRVFVIVMRKFYLCR